MELDRLKGSFAALAKHTDPTLFYRCLYRARVVVQSTDLQRVDVMPEDPMLPPMSNVRLRTGIPGLTVAVDSGATIMVGWEGGKPDRPFAGLWASPSSRGEGDARGDADGGGAVRIVTLVADKIELGGKDLLPLIDGLMTGQAMELVTGMPHWALGNSSAVVGAKKS